jgi:prepilin peptidase CpaA
MRCARRSRIFESSRNRTAPTAPKKKVKHANVESTLSALGAAASDPRIAALAALLAVAVVIDCRSLRIPNWLTLGGALLALALNTLPLSASRTGAASAFAGLAAGFAILLPAYAVKVMGAGDVKLMAMAGAFLGWPDTLLALLFTLVAGGIAALGFAFARRSARRLFTNVRQIVHAGMFAVLAGARPSPGLAAGASAGRLPYSISICAGTLACLAAQRFGS